MSDEADRFLEEAKQRDPERYAQLEQRFPMESKEDRMRARLGEPIARDQARRGKSGRVPNEHRRQYNNEEWATAWAAWLRGRREHLAIERVAEELAYEGMRGY